MGEERVKDRVILDFFKKVRKKYPDARVYLFGSRARKEHLKESDYDIIVVSRYFRNIPFLKRMEKMYEFWTYPIHADILCYTPEELERIKNSLTTVGSAMKEAVEL